MVETNIDDLSPELIGADFQNDLLEKGAIDFYLTAIQMKKGRPGWKLSALTTKEEAPGLSAYILEHTTSIGVRQYPVTRTILQRKQFELDTPYGKVLVKQVITPSGLKRHKIEYESLQALKEKYQRSIQSLEQELYALIRQLDL